METKQRNTKEAKVRALSAIAGIVYTLEVTDNWGADTLNDIVDILRANGFKPRI